MPSGKKSRQQRKAAVPPVRSKGGGGGGSRFSRRTLIMASVVLVVLIGLGVGLPLALGSSGSSSSTRSTSGSGGHTVPIATVGHLVPPPALGPIGPEGIPVESGPDLAPAGSLSPNQSVDGISCQSGEQVAFHIHARLTIFIDGREETVPYGVGIYHPQTEQTANGPFVGAGSCFSWLHTHAADGIIHIESPVQRTYTLGNFFDIWHQPLSATQVGPHKGHVTALVNGEAWSGDPRSIPLDAHNQIQLEVGKPLVGPEQISGWNGL